ncbi:MAG: ABC transporter ATP-binding protein [Actinomycetota bacterium]|nr:ABC transporter ATP-binding protein [Actinomycetota bacterium]
MELPILNLRNVRVGVNAEQQLVEAVYGVTLAVRLGETVGVVGESGSGKTLTCLAAARLLPSGTRLLGGEILFEGLDVYEYGRHDLRSWHGKGVGFVFQDPSTALDPLFTIGSQIRETLRAHGASRAASRASALHLLEEVGLSESRKVAESFPHQLSGGMKQRAAIAMALAPNPKLLIADEPTTALDATSQASVLQMLDRVRQERGLSVVLVTHDVAAAISHVDRLVVMYNGRVIEEGTPVQVLQAPGHPYTEALLRCAGLANDEFVQRMVSIPGAMPPLGEDYEQCMFAARCPYVDPLCLAGRPPPEETRTGWAVCRKTARKRDRSWH